MMRGGDPLFPDLPPLQPLPGQPYRYSHPLLPPERTRLPPCMVFMAMPGAIAAAQEQPAGVVKEVSEDGISVTLSTVGSCMIDAYRRTVLQGGKAVVSRPIYPIFPAAP